MSVLVGLPVVRWSGLVSAGTLQLTGHLPHPLPCVGLDAGSARLSLVFEGAGAPQVVHATVEGDPAAGARDLNAGAPLVTLIEQLCDVTIEATGTPSGGLAMELARDLRLALEPDVKVVVTAHTQGDPRRLRLARPLVVRFGGAGVRLEHGAYRRLSRLAAIRLHRAELHPDGRVRLAGRGPGLADRVVKHGLSVASARVTRMVRDGRRLRSLQPLLVLD